jgi:hypothetical protein
MMELDKKNIVLFSLILELFRQCGILEKFRQCGIFLFFILLRKKTLEDKKLNLLRFYSI